MTVKDLIYFLSTSKDCHPDDQVVVMAERQLQVISGHLAIERVSFGDAPLPVIIIRDGSCTKP